MWFMSHIAGEGGGGRFQFQLGGGASVTVPQIANKFWRNGVCKTLMSLLSRFGKQTQLKM